MHTTHILNPVPRPVSPTTGTPLPVTLQPSFWVLCHFTGLLKWFEVDTCARQASSFRLLCVWSIFIISYALPLLSSRLRLDANTRAYTVKEWITRSIHHEWYLYMCSWGEESPTPFLSVPFLNHDLPPEICPATPLTRSISWWEHGTQCLCTIQ